MADPSVQKVQMFSGFDTKAITTIIIHKPKPVQSPQNHCINHHPKLTQKPRQAFQIQQPVNNPNNHTH